MKCSFFLTSCLLCFWWNGLFVALSVCPPGTISAMRCFCILLVLAITRVSLRPELKVLGDITLKGFAASQGSQVSAGSHSCLLSSEGKACIHILQLWVYSAVRMMVCCTSEQHKALKSLTRRSHSASLLFDWSQERSSIVTPGLRKLSSRPWVWDGHRHPG